MDKFIIYIDDEQLYKKIITEIFNKNLSNKVKISRSTYLKQILQENFNERCLNCSEFRELINKICYQCYIKK